MAAKWKLFLGAVAFGLPLDVLTKEWVTRNLTYADRIQVVDGFFYLTHVRNPGAAFGMFAEAPAEIRLTFFIGVTLVAIALIFSFLRKLAPGDRFAALSLGLILSGAVGNLADRVRYGEVVDVLHVILPGGYAWPDFNFADSLIVVGVIFLVLELFAVEGESRDEVAVAEGES